MKNFRIAALQAAAISGNEETRIANNLSWTVEQLRNLSRYNVDLVCLPEEFACSWIPFIEPRFAETADGHTLSTICSIASELHIAILCPILEQDGQQCFNTAFFIDRSGSIVGKYRKMHPMETEIQAGILPGSNEVTIIDWEGIRVGIQICFDANWPQDWVRLKQAGAEIIFFCSAFSAGKLLESYATILRIPIVAATWCPHCRIYDRCGRIVAHQSPYYPYAIADMLIKQPLFHLDFQTDKVEVIRKEYTDIAVDVHNGEGTWTISGDNLQSVIEKHHLIDVDDYIKRAQAAQKIVRK